MAIYRGTGGVGDSNTNATVTAVTEQATNAANSAVSAANSATQAATSASEAASSEAAVEASALAASTSATQAAASATSAQTAATQATNAESDAEQHALNAATSATNAAASAGAANTSAANALASELEATSQASAANTSALSAQSQATAANTSAVQAQNAATSAGQSATNAALSETNAEQSYQNVLAYDILAEGFKDEAAVSASNAATSETNAATSATNAATSESNAATSESNSSTYAANAATSESNASTYAANAFNSASQAANSATAADTSKLAAQAAQAAAEAAETGAANIFDQFGDQYLGSKASDPIVDNDGDPLTDGDIYWNTTNNTLRFYTGTAWVAPETVATTAATNAQSSASAAAASASAASSSESNAASSASAASTSATNASNSASAAASSASSASSSASSASTSASNASASETAAASSATNAASSASAAATSATNASNSETSAASSASAASTSASNASTSESNASASESAAASSASSASTSASNAANSASSASTSATNAANSASSASTSASNASTSATNAANSASSASSSAAAAAASYDAFDDRYLGSKVSNPSVDNDGDALQIGALYFNTTNDEMMVYTSGGWVAAYVSLGNALLETTTFSGDVSGTYNAIVIADDSHNHTIANVDGLQTALNGKVDDSQVLTNVPAGAVFTDTVYTHPSYAGDDINLDTGPLSGATVISDLDFNVTTDTQGHVTDANATYSTRNLTYSDVGAAAASHSHSNYAPRYELDIGSSGGTRRWFRLATLGDHDCSLQGTLSNSGDYGDYDRPQYQLLIGTRSGSISIDVFQLGHDSTADDWNFYTKDIGSQYEIWVQAADYNKTTQFTYLGGYGSSVNMDSVTTTAPSGTVAVSKFKLFHDSYHPNADKWTTARTLSLTGAVTGSASIDGSGNVSLATTATSDPTLTLSGDASGSATFTNLGNATLSVTIADDSHNHVISNVDGLQAALDGKLSTSGKAADSNLLDGIDSSAFLRSNATDSASGRINFTSGIGINTATTTADIQFDNSYDTTASDVSKIHLYNANGDIYGFGVSSGRLNYRSGGLHGFYQGTDLAAEIEYSGGVGWVRTNVLQAFTGDIWIRSRNNGNIALEADGGQIYLNSWITGDKMYLNGNGARSQTGHVVTTRNDTIAAPLRASGYIEWITDIGAIGTTYFASDAKFKENIADCTVDALAVFDQIAYKQFDWNADSGREGEHAKLGFIAQDIQVIEPDFVDELSDGTLQINQTQVISYLMKAVSELSAKNKELETRLSALEP